MCIRDRDSFGNNISMRKRKNPVAKELRTSKYRSRVKPNKKKIYVRDKDKFKFVGFTDY